LQLKLRNGYRLSALFGKPGDTPGGTIIISAATGIKNAPCELIKLDVHKFTRHHVGHVGIFRKRFELVLWPWLLHTIHRSND
jgi:hypothetical protein